MCRRKNGRGRFSTFSARIEGLEKKPLIRIVDDEEGKKRS